jgi:hypothetical protein
MRAKEIGCRLGAPQVRDNCGTHHRGNGEVQDAQHRDSLFDSGDGGYTVAYDRAGTYTVHVESQGYLPWDTTGIDVRQVGGSCPTVETEVLNARLVPAQ